MPPRRQQKKKPTPSKTVTLKFKSAENIAKLQAILQLKTSISESKINSAASTPLLNPEIAGPEVVDPITPLSGTGTPVKQSQQQQQQNSHSSLTFKVGATVSNANEGEPNLRLQNNINPKGLPMNSNSNGAFALDKTGKGLRHWDKNEREVKSFTGYKMIFKLWMSGDARHGPQVKKNEEGEKKEGEQENQDKNEGSEGRQQQSGSDAKDGDSKQKLSSEKGGESGVKEKDNAVDQSVTTPLPKGISA